MTQRAQQGERAQVYAVSVTLASSSYSPIPGKYTKPPSSSWNTAALSSASFTASSASGQLGSLRPNASAAPTARLRICSQQRCG